MLSRKIKIISWNVFVPLIFLLSLELIVRITVPSIQLPGLDKKILQDSIFFTSPGLRKNSSGTSNGILKEVDKNGFWKLDRILIKDAKRKILLLGDSAAMGIGVENDSTFAGIINFLMENAEIYNSALIGYSSADYLNVVEYIIKREKNNLEITEILIFWCLNDVYSNFPDENSPEYKPDLIRNLTLFFSRNFKLYHFFKHTFSDRPKSYFQYDNSFYDITNIHYNTSISHLIKINSIASSYNIKLQLFLLPYEYQLRNYFVESIFKPQKLILETLKDSIKQIEDLKDAFKSVENDYQNYYLYGDGIHFSQRGHEMIAKYVVNQLKSEFSND